ncbi:histone H2A deubiquitinase MYSM1-like [Mytilus trossulus]|uniref:histone H2A deubiquitinase MYSM1-like n=1 Tax=Mytilus trossulus TaxID=6551 RepID=UPI003005C284
MAEDGEIDIEGDFEFKLEANDVYDTNELPSKSANLLPEYTNPAWMLEQGWSMDSYIDEKSKATIEKMLQEEQYYMNGQNRRRNMRNLTTHKQPWSEEEKNMFYKGLEVYGRSWSKIAELIQTRTNLQVKNFAQQYFKQQTKSQDKGDEKCVDEKPYPSTLEQMLKAVTTAQPTVSASTFTIKTENHIHPQNYSLLEKTENNTTETKVTELEKMLTSETLPSTSRYKEEKTYESLKKKHRIEANKNKKNRFNSATVIKHQSEIINSKPSKVSKPAPLVKIKNVKVISSRDITSTCNESIGLNDVLEVVTIPSVQLSPTLEHKLEKSTGLIENLDGFCAVADIVSGSGDGQEDEEDIDIDIENDDDEMDDNVILKNRSTSPNSVYESLLKSAKVRQKSNKIETVIQSTEDEMPEEIKDLEETSCDTERDENVLISESSEDGLSEGGNQSDSSQHVEKRIANMVVLSNGEVMEFPVPTEEKLIEPDLISIEERKVHLEFFDGRPSKTPDRYVKIRNFILDSWYKSKPNYLNKTSVRPGLKNCGDVNCIGRIHMYLECTGAINFGCEQSCYNHHVKMATIGVKQKGSRDVLAKGFKLNSMRPRKRKIKDGYGNWINEDELQGKTIEHQEHLNDTSYNDKEKIKSSKEVKTFYDPFKLIPCESFTQENPAPIGVEIYNSCLVIMDVHAHVSKTEVIGMLGGQCCGGTLSVTMAIPCNSTSTGMQCEMDPVSQTQASEEIHKYGMSVVGWYHSHPTFNPDPSIRDMETQLKFQEWFSKGGNRYIGIIVSPYNRLNPNMSSDVQCLTVSEEVNLVQMCNKPYKFDYDVVQDNMDQEAMLSVIRQLAEKYSGYQNRVEILGPYRSFTGHTCLSKLLMSISEHSSNQWLSSEFLKAIENIFSEIFSQKGDSDAALEYSDQDLNKSSDESSTNIDKAQSGENFTILQENVISTEEQLVDNILSQDS